MRYLRPFGLPPIEKVYTLLPFSRTTIVVDGEGADLASTDVSAVITAASPIVAERAMYYSQPDQPFAAGHESAGVTAPALEWFLAEGATGTFFDLFVLIANPNASAATVAGRVPAGRGRLGDQDLHGGRQLAVHDLGGRRAAAAGLGIAAVRQRVAVDGGAFDQRRADRRRADDVVAGARADVELLVRGAQLAGRDDDRDALGGGGRGYWRARRRADVRADREPVDICRASTSDGARCERVAVPGRRRPAAEEPDQRSHREGSCPNSPTRSPVLVESLGPNPVPIVVEHATYSSPGGVLWGSGGNALAVPLP